MGFQELLLWAELILKASLVMFCEQREKKKRGRRNIFSFSFCWDLAWVLAPYQIRVQQGKQQPFALWVVEEMDIADVQLKEHKDLNLQSSLSASGV